MFASPTPSAPSFSNGYAPEDAALVQQERTLYGPPRATYFGHRVATVGHDSAVPTGHCLPPLTRRSASPVPVRFPTRSPARSPAPTEPVHAVQKKRPCGPSQALRRVLWLLVSFVCALSALMLYDAASHCDTSVSVSPLHGGREVDSAPWRLVFLSRFALVGCLVFSVVALGRVGTDALIVGVVMRLLVADFLPVAIFVFRYVFMQFLTDVDLTVLSVDDASVCRSMCPYASVFTYIRSFVFGF